MRQGAVRFPFAARRVFVERDFLRLVAFVGVVNFQFVSLVVRRDDHAALVRVVFGNSRRCRLVAARIVVHDGAFAHHSRLLGGSLAFEADGFVAFHFAVVRRRYADLDAIGATRRNGDFESSVGIERDFCPGVATIGADFDFFAEVSRDVAGAVDQFQGDFGIGGRRLAQGDVVV